MLVLIYFEWVMLLLVYLQYAGPDLIYFEYGKHLGVIGREARI